MPALIRRFHEAKLHKARDAVVWGSGNPLRELIFSDDLADACVMLMEHSHADRIGDFINVGSGVEISIKELAQLVARIVGFEGRVIFDEVKPDGMIRRRLDITRVSMMGWKAKTTLADGISKSYNCRNPPASHSLPILCLGQPVQKLVWWNFPIINARTAARSTRQCFLN